jgi:hypothetical protein
MSIARLRPVDDSRFRHEPATGRDAPNPEPAGEIGMSLASVRHSVTRKGKALLETN